MPQVFNEHLYVVMTMIAMLLPYAFADDKC